MSHIILSISSNAPDREAKIHDAIEEMRALLPNLKTSSTFTSPAFNGRDPEYMSVAAVADTDIPVDRLHVFTKAFEWQLGRTPEDSTTGVIPIDIDIIAIDDKVLKPHDKSHPPFAAALAGL